MEEWEIGSYRLYVHGAQGKPVFFTLYKKDEENNKKDEKQKVVYLRFDNKIQTNAIKDHSITIYYPLRLFPTIKDMLETAESILVQWESEENIWVTTNRVTIG